MQINLQGQKTDQWLSGHDGTAEKGERDRLQDS